MQTKTLKNLRKADELVAKLLVLSETERIYLLDSCGVSHLGSRFLLCGLKPIETHEISDETAENSLQIFEEKLEKNQSLAIFTLSYELGLKINRIELQKNSPENLNEPDIFLALFDCWLIFDYETQETTLCGNKKRFQEIENQLKNAKTYEKYENFQHQQKSIIKSNLTKAEYLAKIEEIKEFIRRGDTYQTNLTQQFTAELPENLSPQQIFYNLRKDHPAPFASFLQRHETTVISASPERFFKIQNPKTKNQNPLISTSPIKGTRPRGKNSEEDEKLRKELLNSEKDRAENVMIVDLLRNDLGRICEFGSVKVEKLCDLEEHPTLFHLVSTVTGNLRPKTSISEIIKAVFPCGSITGAPKIRTMQIINELETAKRALSMGAIGFSISNFKSQISNLIDLSVAIRTMTIKNNRAVFNVGGGIVIDSEPEKEYEETLTKAKALFNAINGIFSSDGNN